MKQHRKVGEIIKLYIEMEVYTQIVDVPPRIIEKKDDYRNNFLDWLYNPKVKHNYRVKAEDASGNSFVGLQYDRYALNQKVLKISVKLRLKKCLKIN